jgi:hypothetical protein
VLAVGSLTDLDLTYAFMGIAGAEVRASECNDQIPHSLSHQIIADALEHRHCQLIRLGLTGNSFGDHGVLLLAPALQVEDCLSFLLLLPLSLDLRIPPP